METLRDRRNKTISPRWHRLDIFVSRGAFAEGLPQDRHTAIERPFLDEAVRPDLLQQAVPSRPDVRRSGRARSGRQRPSASAAQDDRLAAASAPTHPGERARTRSTACPWRAITPPGKWELCVGILGLFGGFLQGHPAASRGISSSRHKRHKETPMTIRRLSRNDSHEKARRARCHPSGVDARARVPGDGDCCARGGVGPMRDDDSREPDAGSRSDLHRQRPLVGADGITINLMATRSPGPGSGVGISVSNRTGVVIVGGTVRNFPGRRAAGQLDGDRGQGEPVYWQPGRCLSGRVELEAPSRRIRPGRTAEWASC